MKYLIIILMVILFISMTLISPMYAYFTDRHIECTVSEKERISDAGKYLIFCEEEVLQNSDSLWYWKWNSSDFYRDIKEEEVYTFRVYGWRIPFLSMYRNIIEIN